jgi:hypothetical protein
MYNRAFGGILHARVRLARLGAEVAQVILDSRCEVHDKMNNDISDLE